MWRRRLDDTWIAVARVCPTAATWPLPPTRPRPRGCLELGELVFDQQASLKPSVLRWSAAGDRLLLGTVSRYTYVWGSTGTPVRSLSRPGTNARAVGSPTAEPSGWSRVRRNPGYGDPRPPRAACGTRRARVHSTAISGDGPRSLATDGAASRFGRSIPTEALRVARTGRHRSARSFSRAGGVGRRIEESGRVSSGRRRRAATWGAPPRDDPATARGRRRRHAPRGGDGWGTRLRRRPTSFLRPRSHGFPLRSLAAARRHVDFDPDEQLAVGHQQGIVLWDLTTGTLIGAPHGVGRSDRSFGGREVAISLRRSGDRGHALADRSERRGTLGPARRPGVGDRRDRAIRIGRSRPASMETSASTAVATSRGSSFRCTTPLTSVGVTFGQARQFRRTGGAVFWPLDPRRRSLGESSPDGYVGTGSRRGHLEDSGG